MTFSLYTDRVSSSKSFWAFLVFWNVVRVKGNIIGFLFTAKGLMCEFVIRYLPVTFNKKERVVLISEVLIREVIVRNF